MNAQELRQAVEALPNGKRLPGAIYVLDLPDERIPPVLRKVCDELKARWRSFPASP